MVTIREENRSDIDMIYQVNSLAFGQPDEADLVNRLRKNCPELLSLVALLENKIVGHILFSPATIEGDNVFIRGMGLAPMAVMPEYQRRGIGSKLVLTGLDILEKRACQFIIVLGHPTYYPRFGFEPAGRFGIGCEWDVPGEAFMISLFDKNILTNVRGIAKYHPEFAELS